MVHHVERLVQSLELPYRILKLCGGDMVLPVRLLMILRFSVLRNNAGSK
jgi:hypothetical protein